VPSGVRERGSFPYDPEVPGVGVSGVNLVENAWLVPVAALVGLVIWRYLRNEPIIFATFGMSMITATEVGNRIAEVVRNIITQLFEIATPVLTILGIGEIFFGLLLALGLRQEWLGWRLVIAGLLTLVFTYIIAPFILQFI
jgi:ABC-type uncharacterized transport system fused permease/ATPase subunit